MSTKKPISEPVRLWIEALKSGEYQQGTGRLLKDGKYCCLGVGCEVFIKAGNHLPKSHSFGDEMFDGRTYDLPPPVREWLGMRDNVGVYNHSLDSLASNNDKGKTFLEIADIIESQPEGLFK